MILASFELGALWRKISLLHNILSAANDVKHPTEKCVDRMPQLVCDMMGNVSSTFQSDTLDKKMTAFIPEPTNLA